MSALTEYWFPWFPSRFKADTMHLTVLQDGIYRRLIDHYMETKTGLPDNDYALARIAGISIEEFAPHAEIVRAFFAKATAKLQLKKCDEILADQAERKKSYSERGQKGGRKKTNEINDEKATAKLTATTRQDTTVQDKTGKKETTIPIPIIKNPPYPPSTERGGGFKKIGMGLVGGGGIDFDIEPHLTDYEWREMLIYMPGWDRNAVVRRYNAWIAQKGIPSRPRAAFVGWLKKQPKNP